MSDPGVRAVTRGDALLWLNDRLGRLVVVLVETDATDATDALSVTGFLRHAGESIYWLDEAPGGDGVATSMSGHMNLHESLCEVAIRTTDLALVPSGQTTVLVEEDEGSGEMAVQVVEHVEPPDDMTPDNPSFVEWTRAGLVEELVISLGEGARMCIVEQGVGFGETLRELDG